MPAKKTALRKLVEATPEYLRRRYEDLKPGAPRILEASLTAEERTGRSTSATTVKKKSSAKSKVPAIIRIVSVQQRVEIVLPRNKARKFVEEFGLMFCTLGQKPGSVIERAVELRFFSRHGEHIIVLLTEAELPLLGHLLHRFADAQEMIFQEPT